MTVESAPGNSFLPCDPKSGVRFLKEVFAMRRGSVGPKSGPNLGTLEEVMLRSKNSAPPAVGPGFMRRSCTFVTEGSWRKSSFGIGSGQKETKDRVNLALQVRKKAAQLGECEEEGADASFNAVPGKGRVSRLVGNLKSWSSSEDVRQSVVGAFAKTVNVIKQRPGSKKIKPTKPTTASKENNNKVKPQGGSKGVAPTDPKSKDLIKNGIKGKATSEAKGVKHGPNKTPIPKKKKVLEKEAHPSNTSIAQGLAFKNVPPTTDKKWLRHLHDAQASYNAREGRNRRPHPTPHIPDPEESAPPSDLRDVEDGVDADNSEAVDANKQDNLDGSFNSNSAATASAPQTPSSPESLSKKTESGAPSNSTPGATGSPPPPQIGLSGQSSVGAPRRRLQEVQIIQIVEGPSLIQPSEVKVSQGVVLSAEPVLTPIELLRRKDMKIRQELEEKQSLIADILNIPHQDFESVADMAGEVGLSNKEPRELVLGAIFQAKKLQEALNEAQSVRDSDIIAAQACTDAMNKSSLPLCHTSMDTMDKLLNISGTLTQFLNSLMILISERDDERERMRKELVASRERVHQLHMQQNLDNTSYNESQAPSSQPLSSAVPSTAVEAASPHSSRPSSFVSVNSSNADQSELTDQHNTDEEGKSEDPTSTTEVQSVSQASLEKCDETSVDIASLPEETEASKDVNNPEVQSEGGST